MGFYFSFFYFFVQQVSQSEIELDGRGFLRSDQAERIRPGSTTRCIAMFHLEPEKDLTGSQEVWCMWVCVLSGCAGICTYTFSPHKHMYVNKYIRGCECPAKNIRIYICWHAHDCVFGPIAISNWLNLYISCELAQAIAKAIAMAITMARI